jgi:hypothetical protein
MAGLLVFIPNLPPDGLTNELIGELGLEAVIEPTGHAVLKQDGPDGRQGLMVAVTNHLGGSAKCRYRPQEQQWFGFPSTKPRYYFGWEQAPTPEDLQRLRQCYFGHWTELGDGKLWLVPIALPHGRRSHRIADDGESWITPMPDDPVLSEGLVRYWNWRYADADPVPKSDVNNLCCRALAVHYRIGRPLISQLGLFDDKSIDRCLLSLLDGPALLAELHARKKNDGHVTPSNGSISTDGTEDSLLEVS